MAARELPLGPRLNSVLGLCISYTWIPFGGGIRRCIVAVVLQPPLHISPEEVAPRGRRPLSRRTDSFTRRLLTP